MRKLFPEQIDRLLPQTQCGQCGYSGCMPYAKAIVYENAPINLCPPGGVSTLLAIGNLVGKDPTPFIADMKSKEKPDMLAYIREAECIGCTKCIQACPVDAIIGSAKHMHTVLTLICTGCELCVPACPVDCIDMLPLMNVALDGEKKLKADHARNRFHARHQRISREKNFTQQASALQNKQDYIQAALARVKERKTSTKK